MSSGRKLTQTGHSSKLPHCCQIAVTRKLEPARRLGEKRLDTIHRTFPVDAGVSTTPVRLDGASIFPADASDRHD